MPCQNLGDNLKIPLQITLCRCGKAKVYLTVFYDVNSIICRVTFHRIHGILQMFRHPGSVLELCNRADIRPGIRIYSPEYFVQKQTDRISDLF